MGIVGQFLDEAVAWFQAVWDWINQGLYDLLVWSFAHFIEYWVLATITMKIWAVTFAWDIAKQILVDLGFQAKLDAAWAALPSGVGGLLMVLHFPQALTILITAFVTKFALRFVPGG